MALIIPPGYLQAAYVIRSEDDNEDMVVTCGHQVDGASGASLEQAADDLQTAFATHIAPLMGSTYTNPHTVTYGGNDGPTIVNVSTAPAGAGGQGLNVLPQNSAYLIRKRTNLGGNRGRGRFYLPGCMENVVNHIGVVGAPFVAQVQDALDDWHEFLTEGVGARLYPPVVLHRSEGAGVEPPPTLITKFVMENVIATQRRRLRP